MHYRILVRKILHPGNDDQDAVVSLTYADDSIQEGNPNIANQVVDNEWVAEINDYDAVTMRVGDADFELPGDDYESSWDNVWEQMQNPIVITQGADANQKNVTLSKMDNNVADPDGNVDKAHLRIERINKRDFAGTIRYRSRAAESARRQMWFVAQNDEPGQIDRDRIVAHPSRFGGDLWHLIVAMAVNENFRCVLYHRNNPSARETRTEEAIQALANNLTGNNNLDIRQINQGDDIDNNQAVDAAINYYQNGQNPPIVGATMASTSLLTWKIAREISLGRDPLEFTRPLFLPNTTFFDGEGGEPDEEFRNNKVRVLRNVVQAMTAANVQAGDRVVFINMRMAGGGQNLQHNITENLFNDIYETVAGTFQNQFKVFRIGIPDGTGNWNHIGDTYPIDIYGVDPQNPSNENPQQGDPNNFLLNAMNTDKRLQPFFWHSILSNLRARNAEVIGLVGGRSGGMDIAAWVGVRTLNWDQVNAGDIHYRRLHWTSELTSIMKYDGGQGIDLVALGRWLAGEDFLPVLDDAEQPNHIGGYRGPTDFIGAEDTAAAIGAKFSFPRRPNPNL